MADDCSADKLKTSCPYGIRGTHSLAASRVRCGSVAMKSTRMCFAAWLGFLAVLIFGDWRAEATPILGVIDITPILDRHSVGNSLGLAYNPASNVLYLAHGSGDSGGFIYTLDLSGNLINELNFEAAYRPGSYPTSLSYDRTTGHLFVFAFGVGINIGNIVEMSVDGSTIFREFTVPLGGGGGIVVRDDGIWQSMFANDSIRHYTRDGNVISDVSVASSFPGFPGPVDITSSFTSGFFLDDFFGQRIVEVDIGGNEITAVSTSALGGGLAIDSDASTQRIFLQVNNSDIYILSSQFIEAIPEPNTLILLGSGMVGLIGCCLWRRRDFPIRALNMFEWEWRSTFDHFHNVIKRRWQIQTVQYCCILCTRNKRKTASNRERGHSVIRNCPIVERVVGVRNDIASVQQWTGLESCGIPRSYLTAKQNGWYRTANEESE